MTETSDRSESATEDAPFDDLVQAFDAHDPRLAGDPFPVYAKLRGHCPLTWSEKHGGHWVATTYDAVWKIAQEEQTFSAARPGASIPALPMPPTIPIEVDSPDLGAYRSCTYGVLSPGAVARRADDIERIVTEVLDDVIELGECDLVVDIAQVVPARVTMVLAGFPEEEWAHYLHAFHKFTHEMTSSPEAAVTGYGEVRAGVEQAIADRRKNGVDGPDLVSHLLQAKFNERPLTDDEICSITVNIVGGGLDTTSSTIGNAFHHLGRNVADRQALIDHPELMPTAVEEFLRFDSPLAGLGRTATRDTEVCGQKVKEGDRIWMSWSSANRDERAFPDADKLVLDRQPNRHLAFGVGPHRCLGSNLARAMAGATISQFLRRFPDYRLTGESDRFKDGALITGFCSLPARYTPGVKIATGQYLSRQS